MSYFSNLSATASTNSPGFMPSAAASRKTIVRLGCLLPLSSEQMYERTMPNFSPNCSWLKPLSTRYARKALPNSPAILCFSAIRSI